MSPLEPAYLSPDLYVGILPIAVVSGFLDGLVAALLVRRLGGGKGADHRPCCRLTLGRCVTAGAGTALVFGVKVTMLQMVGLNLFGVIHLLYVDLALIVPGLALGLLVCSRVAGMKSKLALTWAVRAVAVACLFAAPMAGYATYLEPFNLIVERVDVPLSAHRRGTRPISVAVLADLQFTRVTDFERRVIAELMALDPDLILLPGDLFQGTQKQFRAERPAIVDLLSTLDAPGGVYAVDGDVDRSLDLTSVYREAGVRFLDNEVDQATIGDRVVRIAGLASELADSETRAFVRRLEDDVNGGDIRILLTHHPDVVMALTPDSRIDLVVAGHTHGGQVVVPGFGPLLTFSDLPRHVAAGGLHDFNGRRVYISRGVGVERGQAPRIRLFCPPEITLLTLGD